MRVWAAAVVLAVPAATRASPMTRARLMRTIGTPPFKKVRFGEGFTSICAGTALRQLRALRRRHPARIIARSWSIEKRHALDALGPSSGVGRSGGSGAAVPDGARLVRPAGAELRLR